jgi:hypothetical protein
MNVAEVAARLADSARQSEAQFKSATPGDGHNHRSVAAGIDVRARRLSTMPPVEA